MFGSCSTQNPNCFSLMGRGLAWTATTEARLKADLAAGLGTAAIAKKHCWNVVSVRVCHNASHKNVDFLAVLRVLGYCVK